MECSRYVTLFHYLALHQHDLLTHLLLGHARLKDHVSAMPGQLEAVVHEGGTRRLSRRAQLISSCQSGASWLT